MDITQIFTLGVVQGITEFLPISSSGHLVLVPQFLGWEDQGLVFDIALHVGTLLAVMLYFRHDVSRMLCGKLDILRGNFHTENARLSWHLALATLPIIVLALLLKDFVEGGARSFLVLGITSIVFGLLLWLADRKKGTDAFSEITDITPKMALGFGLFQALAIIPGTSRSGICLTGGRFMGCSRALSSHFGTLMAIPTILVAFLYSLLKEDISAVNWSTHGMELGLGIGLSCLTALLGIHLLMTLMTRIGYWPFVVYRVVLGCLLLSLI